MPLCILCLLLCCLGLISGSSVDQGPLCYRYYFGLYEHTPLSWTWNLEKDVVLDIPLEYRELANFRTTLGHKVNHKFSQEANGYFEVVKHPLFGVIVAIIAKEVIEEDEEIFVDYNYTLNPESPDWYKEAHKKYQERY